MIKLRRNHLILLAVILTVGYLAIPAGRQADSERTIVVDNGVGPDEDVVLSPIVKVTAKPTEVYIPRHTVGPDPERPRAVVGKPVMDPKNYDRQEDVMIAVRHAWKGYKDFAFGKDELLPVSKKGHDWFGISLMMLDNVDMLWHLGLVVEFSEVVEYIPDNLKFNSDTNSNLFEVTIRALGGMLAGYYWSGNELLKARATELGDLLMLAFEESKTPIPVASVNFAKKAGVRSEHNGGASSTAEVATLQLEFAMLSHITGDPSYAEKADAVFTHIETLDRPHGLVPIFISPDTGRFTTNEIRLGSRGDSYYEYLIKRWLMGGCEDDKLRKMYDDAVDGIHEKLVGHSKPSGLTFIGELQSGINGPMTPKMDHLVCFLPATLALGVTRGKKLADMPELTPRQARDMELAVNLTHTCVQMYKNTASGLAPEIVYFNLDESKPADMIVKPADRHNLLRPETVESLFVMMRITGEDKYRDWGWEIFQSFEKYARVETGGYTSLNDVTVVPPPKRDKMETFFTAETLKYLFMLFSDDHMVPLTHHVFNTEAHPLPILKNTC